MGLARVETRNCSGGTVITLNRVLWHVTYQSFSGVLPNITAITLQIVPRALGAGGFLLSVFFGVARCLYGEPVNGIATVNAAGEITQIRAEEAPNRFSINLGGIECPNGILRGTLVPLAGTPTIRVRLI